MQRRGGGRTADAGPAAALRPGGPAPGPGRALPRLLVVALAAALAGCGSGSAPVSIGPGPGGADGCVFESGTEVCATGKPAGPSPSGSPSSTPAAPPTTPSATPGRSTPSRSTAAWGGGRRVGSFRTTGTVHGVQGKVVDSKRLSGTCDVARDVRTVTTKVDPVTTLVIAVTGPNVASVTMRVRGGTTWQVDYVGPSARDVATLTPSRTTIAGARMVRVSGPSAAPITLDADFDC